MATERLYYRDCYLSEFDAQVVDRLEGGRRVYLDRTAFYPSSGGQPHDSGWLAGIEVLNVIDEGERIAHFTAAPVSEDTVQCNIDWDRRFDHMQQHTGQHVLSAVFVQAFQIQTLSFHMGSDSSTIEVDANEVTSAQIEEAEQRANAIVRAARPVRIRFEDAEAIQGLRKPSGRAGVLRVIEIDGLDRSACGGTHVRSTAEIGSIQVRKLEKIRGNVRVEFVCGKRALCRAKQDFRILSELSKQIAVPIDQLADQVAMLRQRLTEAEKERLRLAIELAQQGGKTLYDATPAGADGLRRTMLRVPTIEETVRAKVQAFTSGGQAVALVIGSDPPGILVAASNDANVNAGTVLKQALLKAGARGGGSATLAQGSLPDASIAEALAASLGFES